MNGKKILLVDDDQDLLRGMNIRLKAAGYDLVFACDGYIAIKVLQDEKPDLVILDVGSPVGDSFPVMDRMAALFSSIAFTPVIVLTAADPKQYGEQVLKTGAAAFFQKPVNNKILLDTIQKILEQPS